MLDSSRDSVSNSHTYYFILPNNYIKESKIKKEKQTKKECAKAKKELKPSNLLSLNLLDIEEKLIILNQSKL